MQWCRPLCKHAVGGIALTRPIVSQTKRRLLTADAPMAHYTLTGKAATSARLRVKQPVESLAAAALSLSFGVSLAVTCVPTARLRSRDRQVAAVALRTSVAVDC